MSDTDVKCSVVRPGWWHRGNTFASLCYSLGLSPGCCLGLTLCHTWDVFHLSQPMSGGFLFLPPSEGLKIGLNQIGTVSWPDIVLGGHKRKSLRSVVKRTSGSDVSSFR